MPRKRKTSQNNIDGVYNSVSSNHKYLSRGYYYGKLIDWEYVADAMICVFLVYTATEFYGTSLRIRVYVPTALEEQLKSELVTGLNYFVITAPYRINFDKKYQHRVDMLVSIFREVV